MNLDEFARYRYRTRVRQPAPLDASTTALVLIDCQECLRPDELRAEWANRTDLDPADLEPAFREMDAYLDETLVNIGRVLSACRAAGIRPIHVRIGSQLADSADSCAMHKRSNTRFPPGSRGGAFMPPATPLPGEMVIQKTCSGAVTGSNLDYTLRNLGIKSVIVVGFYTDQCVSGTVRDLADLNYYVCLPSDATAAMSRERAAHELELIDKIYVVCESTDHLVARIDALPRP